MTEISYEEFDPDDLLADFVKRFWKFSNPTAATKQYIILPDGYFDLIIEITENSVTCLSLFGLYTKELDVFVPSHTIILGICFKPLATEYILNHSIAGILNGRKSLSADFLSINTVPFDNFKSWTEQITGQLLSKLKNGRQPDARRQNIFRCLSQTNGSLTVRELATDFSWSSRQINRYFRAEFGLSLKTYSNVLRCFASYTQIRAGNLFPAADFHDQSHFIKAIKKHTGVSPTELHQNKNDRFLQFSTLPRS